MTPFRESLIPGRRAFERLMPDGQIPRFLQEKATTASWPQSGHRTRMKPLARMPHLR
jgi:hypothetical protein